MPPWYRNSLENKKLYSFYEKKFWKLYDILLLDRYYISSMIILHQTKTQNVDRLYKLLAERNEHLMVTRWCSKLSGQSYSLIIEQKLNDLAEEQSVANDPAHRLSSYMKPIVMFGVDSPMKRPPINHIVTSRRGSNVTASIKISPARRLNETRDLIYRKDSARILGPQNKSVESPMKMNEPETHTKRPTPLLRPIARRPSEDDTQASMISQSPIKFKR